MSSSNKLYNKLFEVIRWREVVQLAKSTGIGVSRISEVMEDLKDLVGKEIKICVKEAKPKTHWVEREGRIEKMYPNVFIFSYKNKRNLREIVSYTYVDVAVKDVRILEN